MKLKEKKLLIVISLLTIGVLMMYFSQYLTWGLGTVWINLFVPAILGLPLVIIFSIVNVFMDRNRKYTSACGACGICFVLIAVFLSFQWSFDLSLGYVIYFIGVIFVFFGFAVSVGADMFRAVGL